MQKLLLIGFVLFHFSISAQIQQQGPKQPKAQIAAHLQAARDSLNSNLSHSMWATQKAIELAKTNNLPESEQLCYLTLAGFYKQSGQPDLVVRNYERAIALGLPNTTQLLYEKLPYLEQLSDTKKALQDAQFIEKIARNNRDREMQSQALIVLGNIYGKRGENEKSLELLQKAAKMVSEDDIQMQAVVQGYIGDKYNNLNQNRQAEKYYQNSYNISNQVKDTSLIEANFNRLNSIYQKERRSKDIIKFNRDIAKRKKSVPPSKDTTEMVPKVVPAEIWREEVRGRANLNLASAYLDDNANAKAIDILEEMTAETPESDLAQNSEVHKLLSQAYDQSGKYEQALAEYKTYVALQDSLLKQKDLKIEASRQKNIALQVFENQVEFLEKDRQLNAKTIALNESNMRIQQIIILAVVLIALVTLISLFLVIRKNRAKTIANNLLELKSLRTKMNPHFIFNSLNSVNHFIAQNDEKSANKYLSQFSKLMRDVLDSSDKDFIPLEKEIELLDVYLALEHQRFASKFNYTLDVDPATRASDYMIPPMLVQPFIENAIWHGLRYIDYPGQLAVRFTQKAGQLLIEVEDNGIGRAASKALKTKSQNQHNSTGIRNSESRIDLTNKVYGESISVQIVDFPEGSAQDKTGTLVQIGIRNKHEN